MKDALQLMLLEKRLCKTVGNGSVSFKFKNTESFLTLMKQMKKESLKIPKEDLLG